MKSNYVPSQQFTHWKSGEKKGKYIPFTPKGLLGQGLSSWPELALSPSGMRAQAVFTAPGKAYSLISWYQQRSWEWVTPKHSQFEQWTAKTKESICMCFPDMTHSKDAAAKSSLLRSHSVDLQSKSLKWHQRRGKTAQIVLHFQPSQTPCVSWLAHLCSTFLSWFPTTHPHPHESLYFNIKFLKNMCK